MAAWSGSYEGGNAAGDTKAIAGTATEVVAANSRRKELILQNVSANPMQVGIGNGVTTANGITLSQYGSLKLTQASGAGANWFAIYSGGGGDLRYAEFF